MHGKKFRFLILSLTVVVIDSSALGQESKKPERIRVAIPSRSVTYFPLIAAKNQGFYLRQGIDLELILMRPTISTTALCKEGVAYGRALQPST